MLDPWERTVEPLFAISYIHLAKAVLGGLENNSAAALAAFRQAWLQVARLEEALLPPLYQLAEFCEWLFRRTGEEACRDVALNYPDLQNRQDPAAWPDSFRAKNAQTEAERMRALGVALFLDKNAARVADFSAEEKQQARGLFEQNNGFIDAKEDLQKTQNLPQSTVLRA